MKIPALYKITLMGMVLGIGHLIASPMDQSFNQANAEFAEKKYEESIRDFDSIVQSDYLSPEVFFNLANACFRNGQTGKAVLNYKRALWLDPSDPDVRANLKFVMHQAGLYEETRSWWESVPLYLSINGWTWLASLSLSLICVWGICRLFGWKRAFLSIPFILLFVLLISVGAMGLRLREMSEAVVIANQASLKVAPFEKSPSNASLPSGSMMNILKKRDDYYFVQTQDGKSGWVAQDQIEKVVDIP